MLRQFSTRRIIGFFLLDWIGTLGMFLTAASLRIWIGDLPRWFILFLRSLEIEVSGRWVTSGDLLRIPVFIVIAIIWPFFFIVFSVYDGRHNESAKAELLNVFMAICASIAALSGLLYFTYRDTPRILILIFFILDLGLLLGSRVVFWLYRRSQNGRASKRKKNALIVGAGPVGRNAVEQLKRFAWADLELIGFLDDDPEKWGTTIENLPVLGSLNQAAEIVESHNIQEAVVALPLEAHKALVDICHILQGLSVGVHVIPDLFALSFPNAELDGFGGIPVIDLGRPGIQGWRRIVKRTFDVIAVSVAIILLSPLFLLVAVIISLDSFGPIIYRQLRIGENGRPFTMLKFRSMRADADPSIHQAHVARLIKQNLSLEQADGKSLKLENDPRVTRIGHLIRKSSLDELPQLINVLKGEMSLVGPRPPLPYEVEMYQTWHKRRLEVPPGITGLWQVKGRNRVSFDEMVRMDLEYIERQSIWLDLNIIFKTPLALLSARGAG